MSHEHDWNVATADIRMEEQRKAVAASRKAIEAKGGRFSLNDKAKAIRSAKGPIISRLWKLEEVNGVRNPTWDDEVWRGNGEAKLSKEDEALIVWLGESESTFHKSLSEQYGNKGTLSTAQWSKAREGKAESEKEPEADEAAIIEWARQNLWSDFVASLVRQFDSKGSLSFKQWASLRGMKAKMDAKAETTKANESDIDLSELPSGYYSVPDGGTRLKVRVARPTKQSRWYGHIFVSDGGAYGARKNYGRQDEAGGGKYTGEIQDALRAILENPVEAVTAYGKLTGTCGACGRVLEDEDSLERGIGPVCATKFEM